MYRSCEGRTGKYLPAVLTITLACLVVGTAKTGFAQTLFPPIENPLFEELMTDTPGPNRFVYYSLEDTYPDTLRAYTKKFGLRYVLQEQRDLIMSRPLIPHTGAWGRGGVGSYETMRMISNFKEATTAPKVFGDQPWFLDPRWQETWLEKAAWLAEIDLDLTPGNESGNTWALWVGDEVFENTATRVVPPELRDDVINALDEEVKQQFGFGIFGMPDSEDDPNVFRHIAYRRWANAEMAQLYQQLREQTALINPDLKIVGPTLPAMCLRWIWRG